jgi:hypothetical protein
MKNTTPEEQRFQKQYGHFRQVDPFETGLDEQDRLTGKILERVYGAPERPRGRMIIWYAGVSAVAAAMLLLVILKPQVGETPVIPAPASTLEVTINDLPEMDEALVREVVMESLEEDEDIFSFDAMEPEDIEPNLDDQDDDYIQYFVKNMTLDEIVELLIHDQPGDL